MARSGDLGVETQVDRQLPRVDLVLAVDDVPLRQPGRSRKIIVDGGHSGLKLSVGFVAVPATRRVGGSATTSPFPSNIRRYPQQNLRIGYREVESLDLQLAHPGNELTVDALLQPSGAVRSVRCDIAVDQHDVVALECLAQLTSGVPAIEGEQQLKAVNRLRHIPQTAVQAGPDEVRVHVHPVAREGHGVNAGPEAFKMCLQRMRHGVLASAVQALDDQQLSHGPEPTTSLAGVIVRRRFEASRRAGTTLRGRS